MKKYLCAIASLLALMETLLADPARLRLEPPQPGGAMRPVIEGQTGSVYKLQYTPALTSQWSDVLYVAGQSNGVPVLDREASGATSGFYRAIWMQGLNDTNSPTWPAGVQTHFQRSAPYNLLITWGAASDNTGVAEYRIYRDGVLCGTVQGNIREFLLAGIDPSQRADLRIEAVDASGNVSASQSLLLLPGDRILAVTDDGGRVYVSYMDGSGAFVPLQEVYNFGAQVRGAAVGDFDRDGVPDLITGYVSYSSDWRLNPFFFKGRGDGSFEAPKPISTAYAYSWTAGMAAGDFDADGNLDFVASSGDTGWLGFYWGNGDGTFAAEARSYPGNGRDIDAGDFNEDGLDDFVRATYGDGMIRMYLSNGDRTFAETNLVGDAGEDPYGVAAGDFDEDGHLDVIANFGWRGDITFWKGNGDGTFTNGVVNDARANLDVDNYSALDAYDFDHDGHLDAVLSAYSARTVYYWRGLGDGTFDTNVVVIPGRPASYSLGLAAPPLPPAVDVSIAPLSPARNLNEPLILAAQGSGVASNDLFRWTFGTESPGNTLAMSFGSSTNVGPTATNRYAREGRFLARLQHVASGGTGRRSVRGTWVTVHGQQPMADAGGPYTLGEGAALQAQWTAAISGAASTDDFGIVTYVWNFGDGTRATNTAPGASHTWGAAGSWPVGLTVFDASGQSSTGSTTVTFVPGAPPVASITGPDVVDETSANSGVWSTRFWGTNSTDDFGIWKYEWTFGDGKSGSGNDVRTTYGATNSFTVTLTVTDHAGQTNRVTKQVLVKANGMPTAVISGERLLAEAVATNGFWGGSWDASASTDDTGIYRFEWDFGDGTSATGVRASHQYSHEGVYRLNLKVFDNGNQTAAVSRNVVVASEQPPVARISAEPLIVEGAQPVRLSGAGSTDDHGVAAYRWSLPPRLFDFRGSLIDQNQWRCAGATQSDRLVINAPQRDWGRTYFFSGLTRLERGCALQARVDTAAGESHCMVGLRNLDFSTGRYNSFVYAVYFQNGMLEVYEYGGYRGQFGSYTRGATYEIRIETKPGSGARFYIRQADSGDPFRLFYDNGEYSDAAFSFGADVWGGTWGFDDLLVDHIFATDMDIERPIYPGGEVSLDVTDNAGLSNRTSVAIQSVTGAVPVAAITPPGAGLYTGVELNFSGYGSEDDHGIASYRWDFGDGTEAAHGAEVSHAYRAPGRYTVTLTVMDYAGQSRDATYALDIAGDAAVVAVPWRIVGDVELPHETWFGLTNTLKASAGRVPVPFDYIWDFGDGSAPVTNTCTTQAGAYGLEARHAYIGAEGTPFFATVTVVETNGMRSSDTYPLLIRPRNLDTEMNVAIDNGLWWLHKVQQRTSIDSNTISGFWEFRGYGYFTECVSASALQAFEINGHVETGDANQDPYVETVKRGMNYVLSRLYAIGIGAQRFGNPDGNGNGIGLSASDDRAPYNLGPIMDAFVAGGRPDLVARTGGANVKGRTYRDLVQDMVDMYAWGQSDADWGGGWRYSWNSDADNSVSQWGPIGMVPAERFWGIATPGWVKARNLIWLQNTAGGTGFGYTGPDNSYTLTPSALVQASFAGLTTDHALWKHGEAYVANNWSWVMGYYDMYAEYAIAKAMRLANPPVIQLRPTGKDWFLDPVDGLGRLTVDRQDADGSWLAQNRSYLYDRQMDTAWSIIILTSSIFQQGPVAVIHARPNPTAVGYPVVFDARGSFHLHPSYRVVEYRWDFNAADGLNFDAPDAVGAVVTNAFGAPGTNTVTLQVRDNGTPTLYDTANVTIRVTVGPHPPTADAAGPYVACVGQDIELDGSGSFDVDESQGDSVRAWDWETDFQRPLDFDDGHSGEHVTLVGGYPAPGRHDIGLRVTDRTSTVFAGSGLEDLTDQDFTTVYIYNKIITDLQARPKGEKCQLTWTWHGDVCAIMRSEDGPFSGFTEVGRTTNRFATYLDMPILMNHPYYYRIYVYNQGGREPIGISDAVFVESHQRDFENQPPSFTGKPFAGAQAGQLYQQQLQAEDPENDPLAYAPLIVPTGMTVSAAGLLSFVPAPDQIGSQNVSVQVSDGEYRDVLSYSLIVFPASNNPPVVAANGPYRALEGAAVGFSSAGTADADGDPLRYAWNFGDGQTSTNESPSHVYAAAGSYLASLFVSDGNGGKASASVLVTVERPNRPPVAAVTNRPPFALRLGEALAMDGSASYDLDGERLSYLWNWGDGSAADTALRASHTYPRPGVFQASLAVRDTRAGEGRYDFTVTVGPANRPPAPVLRVVHAGAHAGDTFLFDASGSADADGDPLLYRWDFGDQAQTTGDAVTHVYRALGSFTVALTAQDTHGASATVTQDVAIVNAPPEFTGEPTNWVTAGTLYEYTPTVTDNEGDPVTFALATNPATMSIDTNTGAITWLPGTNDLGPNAVAILAADSRGDTTALAFDLYVLSPAAPRLDLEPTAIVAAGMVVDAQSLAATGSVEVQVQNHSTNAVPLPCTVTVFEDRDYDGSFSNGVDQALGWGNLPAGLREGYIAQLTVPVRGTVLFSGSRVFAFVDSADVVNEFIEGNNIKPSGFDCTGSCMDLSASFLRVDRSGLPGEALITARLGNSGSELVSSNVAVSFYEGDPLAGGVLLGTARSTNSLAPGRYEDVAIVWTTPVVTSHQVYAWADDTGGGAGERAERSESNNVVHALLDLAANEPPAADAGPDQAAYTGWDVQLNGTGSRDPESKPLAYKWSMYSIPIGSTAQLYWAETPQPVFRCDVPGDYVAQLVVSDGEHDSAPDSVTVTVTDPRANHSPEITSRPAFEGMVNTPYSYRVAATDPDGDTLTFRLSQKPAGMTIDAGTGLIAWTPSAAATVYVQVVAEDGRGGGCSQGYQLAVEAYENRSPEIISSPATVAQPGVAYQYDVDAADFNAADTLTYSLPVKPAGMSINGSSGLITWTPAAGQLGGNAVRVVCNDNHGGSATQAFTVVVVVDNVRSPAVSPIPDQTVEAPSAFVAINLDSYVTDPDNAKSELTWSVTGASVLQVSISNRLATVTYSPGTTVAETLTFLARDPDGNSGATTARFTAKASDAAPVAAISNLSDVDATSISDGFFELKGTADDPDAIDSVAWSVRLYTPEGAFVKDVTPAPVNAAGYHEGRVSPGGSFGRLDLTMLRNGTYTVMLEVVGGNRSVSALGSLALDSELKLGQMRFSEQDLVLPARGVGMRVIRTYDSFDPDAADFGNSWTYSVTDLKLSINEQRVDTTDLFEEPFSLRTGGGRDVTLDMPDSGRRVTFRYSQVPYGMFRLRAVWTPPPGVGATLEPTVSPNQIVIQIFSQRLTYWEAAPLETSLENFDFPGFILTLKDGTKYRIDREYLGSRWMASDSAIGSYVDAYGKAFLTRITETTGDHTEFVRNGTRLKNIETYDSADQKLTSMLFHRDSRNRIAAIYTPEALDLNGVPTAPAAVKYEYDDANNLVRVSKLAGAGDPDHPVYNSTTYLYEHPRFPHYLTEVRDARGVTTLKAEFDDSGRLVGVLDAFGNRTSVTHDIAARSELTTDALGNTTTVTYDERGNVVAEVDPLGNSTLRTFDDSHHVLSETDAMGNTRTFTYDAGGNRTSVTDPLGNTTRYAYDAGGRLLSETDPLGRTTTNSFDAKGRPLASVDPAGQRLQIDYGTDGRVATARDGSGAQTVRFEYDSSGNLTSLASIGMPTHSFRINAKGNATNETYTWINPTNSLDIRTVTVHSSYDATGLLLNRTYPSGRQSTMTYDPLGNVTSVTDEQGNVVRYLYDATGRQIETTRPDGYVVRTVYDAVGRPVVVTHPHPPGAPTTATRTTYNASGRAVASELMSNTVINVIAQGNSYRSVVRAGGTPVSSNSIAYDAVGRPTNFLSEAGSRVSYEYDAAGRRTAQIDAAGRRTEFEYDAAGLMKQLRTPADEEAYLLYDAGGRLRQTVFPDGSAVQTSYDSAGNAVSVTDPTGQQLKFEYDGARRITAAVQPAVPNPEDGGALESPRYEYAYDVNGNLASLRDAKGRLTAFAYDELNQLCSRTMPLGQSESRSYNTQGLLQSVTSAGGNRQEYRYDALRRMTNQLWFAPGENIPGMQTGYAYDGAGHLLSVTDVRGVTKLAYDTAGRLTQMDSPEGSIHYEYGDHPTLARRTRMWTQNSDIRYTYDVLGRLRTVTVVKQLGQALTTPETTTFAYNSLGLRESMTLPNGIRTSYQYDVLHRLTLLTRTGVASNLLSSYAYQLAPDGLRTGVTEIVRTGSVLSTNRITYSYDAVKRLAQETVINLGTGAGYDVRYTYDLVGNRLERRVIVGGTTLQTAYTYDENDRLLMESNTVSSASLGGGNLLTPARGLDGSLIMAEQRRWSRAARSFLFTLPYALGLGFLLPALLIPACRWRRLRVLTLDLRPSRALFPRCLAGLLATLTALLPLEFQADALETAGALSTDTWGTAGTVTRYEYDANGALIRKATTGARVETVDYAYDLANHLTSVVSAHSEGGHPVVHTERYTYNQSGIRVGAQSTTKVGGVTVAASTNLFLVDMVNPSGVSQVLEELPAAGAAPTVSYVLGDTALSQTRDDGGGTTEYLLPDGHGSNRQVAGAGGDITDSYAYDAFGLMLGGNPTAANASRTRLLYNGEMFEPGTGLYDLRARLYDPGTGRFTSADPFGGRLDKPETLHRYIFGANDPVDQIDPTGELSTFAEVGLAIIIVSILASIAGNVFSGPGSSIGGDWEVFKAKIKYAGCPAWPHVLGSANSKDAKETARLIRHFEDWYRANQYNMQHISGGALAVWAHWACVDHAVNFARYLKSKRNEDPDLPLLTYYRLHVMGEKGVLGTLFGGYGHTFLIARKRGLAATSPDDIGINFDSWYLYSGAPQWRTYYDTAADTSDVYSEFNDLY